MVEGVIDALEAPALTKPSLNPSWAHREVDVGLRAVDEHINLTLPIGAQPPHALLERLAQRPLAGDGRLVRVRVKVG